MSQSIYEIDFTGQMSRFEAFPCVLLISQKLTAQKRRCWVAGGAVRDLYLNRPPVDIDLVTDALDEEILQLFPQAVLVGQKFGVYKIPFNENNRNIIIDLAVFREEDEYVDGRRPASIKRSNPLKDAERRDFTMNALFYDLENHQVIDYVGGLSDIQNKILKCVGDPQKRLKEDHLRLLRMARFQAQFMFKVNEVDLKMALQLADLITTVSGERIYEELSKVVKSKKEKEFWAQPLTQALWKSLGGELAKEQLVQLPLLNQVAFSPPQRLVMGLLLLSKYSKTSVEFLKTRLKCSKEEERFGLKVIEIYKASVQKKAAVEIALDLDTDRDLESLLLVLEFLSLHEVKNILTSYKQTLLSGGDLVGKCEPALTSQLLRLVRQAQFEGKVRTSDEALTLLKNLKKIQ